jgi:4-methyl-5(b-hydroxyethyl)-thiazole monophosphate biosynthesis
MKKILLLMLKGSEIYEAAAFYDVFGWSKSYGEPVEAVTCGLSEKVECTFGLKIIPDIRADEVNVENFEALAVPGGFGEYGFYEEAYIETVSKLINEFVSQNKPVASICTGAFPLAKSGILKNRKGTTYHLMKELKKEQLAKFGVNIQNDLIVKDGNIITSSCPATAIEVALKLLETVTNKENANKIKMLMGF